MGLLSDCEELFGTSDLYKLFGVPRETPPKATSRRRGPPMTTPAASTRTTTWTATATGRHTGASCFPKITLADVEKYLAKYRGSDEELADLKACYERFKGDFDAISEHLIGYEIEEEDRYRNILNKLIEDGEMELGLDGSDESLANAIAKRQRSREADFGNLIANLEAKYCKPKKKKVTK
ncbi:hypothetical protein MRX96_009528 [Rhipicephalus microplus]